MKELYSLSFLAVRGCHRHYTDTRYSSKLGASFGSIHLVLGFVSLIFGTVGLIAEYQANKYGAAIWCGLVFEMTGATGIVASRRWYRRSYTQFFCIASVVSTCVALLLFALTCVGIGNHYAHWTPGHNTSLANYVANVSANIIVLSIIELIVSLISATVAVKAMRWRCRPPSQRNAQSVVVRETFMFPGNSNLASDMALPADIVHSAPSILAAIHRLATHSEGAVHLQLSPTALLNQQIPDSALSASTQFPTLPSDSHSDDADDDNRYDLAERDQEGSHE